MLRWSDGACSVGVEVFLLRCFCWGVGVQVSCTPSACFLVCVYMRWRLHKHAVEYRPRRCVAADPRHGERWTAVSKNPANAHKDTETLLREVAAAMAKEERAAA